MSIWPVTILLTTNKTIITVSLQLKLLKILAISLVNDSNKSIITECRALLYTLVLQLPKSFHVLSLVNGTKHE